MTTGEIREIIEILTQHNGDPRLIQKLSRELRDLEYEDIESDERGHNELVI